jgi:predicted nuclease of restriction endonuclease-like (RecB) superfamily
MHQQADSVFKDSYMLEFLGLPDKHHEADLHRGLMHKQLLQAKLDEFYEQLPSEPDPA